MDLYQQGFVNLDQLEIFVLDEADRMLDMGFIHDVKKILKWLPRKKQTMLFSATMPPEIAELVNSLLHDPVRVAVDPVSSPVEAIEQSRVFCGQEQQDQAAGLSDPEQLEVKNALVFTRTKHGANKVARDLAKAGITAAAIHGNKSQTARQQALADFKAGKIQCLVATDIAARGLDIEELSHVFNYNLPEVPETYVHRIGRTGRAGREGQAVAFCDFGEKPLLRDIEKLMGRTVPVVEDHPYPMEVLEAPKRDKHGRIINEEDAEARAAAKERRRAQDAANKAAAEERKKKAGEAVLSAVSAVAAAVTGEGGSQDGRKETPPEKGQGRRGGRPGPRGAGAGDSGPGDLPGQAPPPRRAAGYGGRHAPHGIRPARPPGRRPHHGRHRPAAGPPEEHPQPGGERRLPPRRPQKAAQRECGGRGRDPRRREGETPARRRPRRGGPEEAERGRGEQGPSGCPLSQKAPGRPPGPH